MYCIKTTSVTGTRTSLCDLINNFDSEWMEGDDAALTIETPDFVSYTLAVPVGLLKYIHTTHPKYVIERRHQSQVWLHYGNDIHALLLEAHQIHEGYDWDDRDTVLRFESGSYWVVEDPLGELLDALIGKTSETP